MLVPLPSLVSTSERPRLPVKILLKEEKYAKK